MKKKAAAALATGVLLIGLVATSVSAAHISISGNGAFSANDVSVREESDIRVHQENDSDISNVIEVRANTGNNSAGFNTGGDSVIVTGDAGSSVTIQNTGNVNALGLGKFFDGIGNGVEQRRLSTFLTGSQEVPGPGDPNGFGSARVRLNIPDSQVCVSLRVANIEPATAAHIHIGSTGVAGGVVVTLPTPSLSGFASGCVNADSATIMQIRDNPSNYYVNVHNSAFPDGAIRGQL